MVALGLSFLALRSVGAQPATAATARTNPSALGTMVFRLPVSLESSAALFRPLPGQLGSPSLGTAAEAVAPEIRAEIALTVADDTTRNRALADALTGWATTDAGAALVWLECHPEQACLELMGAIGEGLASDPAAASFALTYLAQDRESGALLAGALVRALGTQGDATGALRLTRAAPEGWAHEWATTAFTNLAYEDVATALDALAGIEDPALRPTAAAAIIAGWAERDPAELASHADVFAEPAERTAALETALAVWQQRDPVGAALFAAGTTPPSGS